MVSLPQSLVGNSSGWLCWDMDSVGSSSLLAKSGSSAGRMSNCGKLHGLRLRLVVNRALMLCGGRRQFS